MLRAQSLRGALSLAKGCRGEQLDRCDSRLGSEDVRRDAQVDAGLRALRVDALLDRQRREPLADAREGLDAVVLNDLHYLVEILAIPHEVYRLVHCSLVTA